MGDALHNYRSSKFSTLAVLCGWNDNVFDDTGNKGIFWPQNLQSITWIGAGVGSGTESDGMVLLPRASVTVCEERKLETCEQKYIFQNILTLEMC